MMQTLELAPHCHRVMLFLLPEPTVAETIEQKGRTDWAPDFRGKRLHWSRLHVTTCLFAQCPDRPDRLIEDIKTALNEVRFMPFWMGFDWVCSFGSGGNCPRVLACSNDDKFQYLRQRVRKAVSDAGYADRLRPKHD